MESNLENVNTVTTFLLHVNIQQDEDQEDADERHDPASDMDVDGSKHPDETSRYLFS